MKSARLGRFDADLPTVLSRKSQVGSTAAVVSLPFAFEGERTRQTARQSLMELKTYCGLLVCCPLDRLSELAGGRFLVIVPESGDAIRDGAPPTSESVVAYDEISAGPGQV